VIGTPRRDVIRLTGPGHVRSGAGNDVVCGSPYMDVIETGAGNDVVIAGRGHDRIRGGAGNDNLFGEGGNDHVDGGAGRDFLAGGAGRNRVVPRPGASENGAAGDTVASGWRGASFVVGPDVMPDGPSASQAVISFPPQSPASQGLSPAWLAFTAYGGINVGVAIRDMPAVYWGLTRGLDGIGLAFQPLQPGREVAALGSAVVPWGTTWSFGVQPGGGQFIPAPGGTPGTVTLVSPGVPADQYAGGLMLEGQTLSGGGLNPAQAVQLSPTGSTSLRVGSRIQVRLLKEAVRVGTLVGAPPPQAGFATAPITRSAPTAMVLINPAAGTVSG